MTSSPLKDRTRAHFAGVAESYRLSTDHTDAEDRRILIARFALSPSHVVLDVASGGGQTAVTIAPSVRRVVASDLTPEMLGQARLLARQKACGNMEYVAADAELLPFRSEAFDRVTCRIAPHHFPDLRGAIAEMLRVTKRGGLVGIVDSVAPEDPALDAFINGVERLRDPTHVRSYRVEEWVSFLKDAGLFLTYVSCAWKEHAFPEWVARTGRPEPVRREVEEMFLNAFPRAKDFYRVLVAEGRVLSYADEKGIFIGRKR